MSSDVELTVEQTRALEHLVAWIKNPGTRRRQYTTLGGYAGTGKTTVIARLCEELPSTRFRFCAYTAKAAAVLRGGLAERGLQTTAKFRARSATPSNRDGRYTVTTIHGLTKFPFEKFYCARTGESLGDTALADEPRARCRGLPCQGARENCPVRSEMRWTKRVEIPHTDFIVLDEASMVDEHLWQDLLDYGVPVIAVGDHGQLPPIRGSFNLMADENLDVKLETIMRQAEESAIIRVATLARETGKIPHGFYDSRPESLVVKMDLGEFDRRWGDNVTWDDEIVVLCGRNATRCQWNQLVRGMRGLGSNGSPLDVGERLVCLRNTSQTYNGMTGTVARINRVEAETADVAIRVDDAPDSEPMHVSLVLAQLGRESKMSTDEMRAAQVSGHGLWDYAYAWTTHKAQGSTIKRVILVEERLWKMGEADWRRWLYTAVTRAKEKLIIIG